MAAISCDVPAHPFVAGGNEGVSRDLARRQHGGGVTLKRGWGGGVNGGWGWTVK